MADIVAELTPSDHAVGYFCHGANKTCGHNGRVLSNGVWLDGGTYAPTGEPLWKATHRQCI